MSAGESDLETVGRGRGRESTPAGKWIRLALYAAASLAYLGYGGYLPFALEIYALYHLAAGLLGEKRMHYVNLEMEPSQTRAPGKASG